jgi:DNA-binding transcriptional ArsR family regulator
MTADDRLSQTFAALADPTRRAMLAQLSRGETTVNELAAPHAISLPAVSRHLKVLERTGLVVKTPSAQWRLCRLDTAPLAEADVWLAPYRAFFDDRFSRLQQQLSKTQEEDS